MIGNTLYISIVFHDCLIIFRVQIFLYFYRLVHNRELQLYDGKRLISSDRYQILLDKFGLTKEQLNEKGVLRIHPDFRVIAIGELPDVQSLTGNWMSPETLSLFIFHEMRNLSKVEEMNIISSKVRNLTCIDKL